MAITCGLFVLILFSTLASAGENLENWDQYVEPANATATFTPNGEKLSIYMEDDPATNQAFGMWYKSFPSAYGTLATFKVNSYTGGNVASGLRKYVGFKNGNPILAENSLQVYQGQYRIRYRVREKTTGFKTAQTFTQGVLGDWDGMWALGDQVTIGLANVNGEMYFYTDSVSAYTKVQLIGGITPLNTQWSDIEIFGWVWDTDGNITAEVSDVTLLQK